MFEHSGKTRLREAMVAGIFYPGEGAALAAELRRLLEAAPEPGRRGASAILAPHASYPYAGDLYARAWKAALGRRVDRLVILAPYHGAEESGVFLPESELFECPLGPLAVDLELLAELEDCGTLYVRNDIPHLEEHGIEVQLPFARLLFPEARILPILLGKPSPASIKALSAGLDLVVGPLRETSLLVISSDLESSADPGRTEAASRRLLDLVRGGEARALREGLARGEFGACGAGCIAAYLGSSLAEEAFLLGLHDSSACRESSEESFVHYAALAFGGREEAR